MVVKNNRPLSDYKFQCDLDRMKDIDIGTSYLNEKAATEFLIHIASVEREKVQKKSLWTGALTFLVMSKKSYIQTCQKGIVAEDVLSTDSPRTTCSNNLFKYSLIHFFFQLTSLMVSCLDRSQQKTND